MAALVPVMIFPVLIGGIMERNGVRRLSGRAVKELREELFSEAAIAERAEIALKGIGL